MPIDPASPEAVRDALTAYLRARFPGGFALTEPPAPLGRGFDTQIYGFRVAGEGVPDAWRHPLVLRIYRSPEEGDKAEREAAVQAYAAAKGYCALAPIATERRAAPFGLPIMIIERIEGGTLLDAFRARPLGVRGTLASLGEAHAALHRLDATGAPLPYDAPLVDRMLAQLDEMSGHMPHGERTEGLAWLRRHADAAQKEEPALLHGDFHPLNVLRDAAGHLYVIDWSEAAIGDRHSDVARTVTLLRFAEIAATSLPERLLLRALRGVLRGGYLGGYARTLPLDVRRLRYWEALHTFRAWAQLAGMHAEGQANATEMAQALSPRLQDKARSHFRQRARAFGSPLSG